MPNEDKKLALAKKYIAQGKGNVARPILESIAHVPEAQDLLLTLDSLPAPQKRSSLLTVILLLLAICSLFYFFTRPENPATETQDKPTLIKRTKAESTGLTLVLAAGLESAGYDVMNVGMANRTLYVELPATQSGFDSKRAYQLSMPLAVAAGVVGGYGSEGIDETPPQSIYIDYIENGIVAAQIRFFYADAVRYVEGKQNLNDFMGKWLIVNIEYP